MSESSFMVDSHRLPQPFIFRRLHSLLGLWLCIYLLEHFFVNAQASGWFGGEGSYFIALVNKIHALPFLPVFEIVILGLPFLLHAIWGIRYAIKSKANSGTSDGSKPALHQYRRNRAYTWQRITSWLLLIGIAAHVVQMRFMDAPDKVEGRYVIMLPAVQEMVQLAAKVDGQVVQEGAQQMRVTVSSAGVAFYLLVMNTFRSPLMVILYSILVVAGAYHGFNGLWTFLLSWGVVISVGAQRAARYVTLSMMGVVMALGLIAIWGTHWAL